jgi:hypothetical protein
VSLKSNGIPTLDEWSTLNDEMKYRAYQQALNEVASLTFQLEELRLSEDTDKKWLCDGQKYDSIQVCLPTGGVEIVPSCIDWRCDPKSGIPYCKKTLLGCTAEKLLDK